MGTGFGSNLCTYRRDFYLETVSDGGFVNALPGIMIQLMLIPVLVERLYCMEGTLEWN